MKVLTKIKGGNLKMSHFLFTLGVFNLTCIMRSEAKVDLGGHFKNMSK